MSESTAVANIDGASRGNPGPAAYAVVLQREGQPVVEEANTLGSATNNVAEYTALLAALELASELGVQHFTVKSDSELLVKQMRGEYKVKHPDLQDLYREAQTLRSRFASLRLEHVRREQNKRADQLCNEALDGKPRPRGGAAVPATPPASAASQQSKPTSPATTVSDAKVRDDCIVILSSAAKSWADHGETQPPVGLVWDQLWSVLEESGVLKKQKS
jgi:ribonuclease HI